MALVTNAAPSTDEAPVRVAVSWRLAFIVVLNLPFVLGLPSHPLVTAPFIRSALVNAVLFVAPGAPFVLLLAGRGWLRSSFWLWVLALSLLVFISVVAVRHAFGVPVSADGIWVWTWVATNVGLALNLSPAVAVQTGPRVSFRRAAIFVGILLTAYGTFYFSATRVVPAVGDQDDEIQGTSYALVTRLKPGLLTTRKTNYLFAHPPMINIFVAGSILYYNALDDFARHDPQTRNHLALEGIDRYYVQAPHLLETRTPNIFLGALTVALLGDWMIAMTGAAWFGGLIALAYITSPDVFVRSAYGGYFTISTFFLLQMLMAAEDWLTAPGRRERKDGLLAGGLAAIADHKAMVLPGAVLAWTFARNLKARWSQGWIGTMSHPVVFGFGIGTALFWSYGLAISPHDFWMDHVRHHLVDRVLNNNARGLDMTKYPGVPALWLEFWRHTNFLLLPAGVVALAWLCGTSRPAGLGEEESEPGWRGTSGLWAIWAVMIAIAFSIIDWRQTKHLAPLTLPLTLAIARLGERGTMRLAVSLLLVVLVALNARTLALLAADFTSLPTVPEW